MTYVQFPSDWPETATQYGTGAAVTTHAAYRGEHRLPHQSQQVYRDLFAVA